MKGDKSAVKQMLVRLGYTMDDGKETKGADFRDGEGSLFDDGQEGRSGPSQGIDGQTPERDRQESGEEAVGGQGFVYFFETEDSQYVKIGYSMNVNRRMGQIGTLVPMRLLGYFPGSRSTESWLHAKFEGERHTGEWFRTTVELRQLIAMLGLMMPEPEPEPEPESEPEAEPVMELEMGEPVRCLRCGNEWIPRVSGRPKQCPSCHQAKWDVPAWTGRPAGRPKGKKKAA